MKDAQVTGIPEGKWTPVVRVGERTVVAVRGDAVRQVWVGIGGGAFARMADYAVFWKNVFDWVGEGGEQFSADVCGGLDASWKPVKGGRIGGNWPGVYERGGERLAMNAGAVKVGDAAAVDWRGKLEKVRGEETRSGGGRRPIGRELVLAAMAAVLVAAGLWRRGE